MQVPVSGDPVHILNINPEDFRNYSDALVHKQLASDPLSLVPVELAMAVTPDGVYVDHAMMHRIRMFNVRLFDRLTEDGYKLNLVEGRFEKINKYE